MWSAKDRNYLYRDVFEDFYRYMGTDIPMDDVFNIKVNINKDPEGYEKLRNLFVGFFSDNDIVISYLNLGYVGLKDYDAAMDLIESFVRIKNNISGSSLDIHESNPDKVFQKLVEYEKVFDKEEIGQLSKLRGLAYDKSVFTIRELFDFFNFEFKTYFVEANNSRQTFESVVRLIIEIFNYDQEYILTHDQVMVENLIQRWKEETNNDFDLCRYEKFKDLIFEAASSDDADWNSPLRTIFHTIGSVVGWIANDFRSDKRDIAIRSFMKILQNMIEN